METSDSPEQDYTTVGGALSELSWSDTRLLRRTLPHLSDSADDDAPPSRSRTWLARLHAAGVAPFAGVVAVPLVLFVLQGWKKPLAWFVAIFLGYVCGQVFEAILSGMSRVAPEFVPADNIMKAALKGDKGSGSTYVECTRYDDGQVVFSIPDLDLSWWAANSRVGKQAEKIAQVMMTTLPVVADSTQPDETWGELVLSHEEPIRARAGEHAEPILEHLAAIVEAVDTMTAAADDEFDAHISDALDELCDNTEEALAAFVDGGDGGDSTADADSGGDGDSDADVDSGDVDADTPTPTDEDLAAAKKLRHALNALDGETTGLLAFLAASRGANTV